MKLLLDSRDERPLEFMAEYFNSMQRGDHILLRDYEYCDATPYNRLCLMMRATDALKTFGKQHCISADDMCQLLCLLCPDFPSGLVHEAARLTEPYRAKTATESEGRDELYEASQVLIHLRFLFYFSEFVRAISPILREAMPGGGSGVRDLMLIKVKSLVKQANWPCPSVDSIERIVSPYFESGYECDDGFSLKDSLTQGLSTDPEVEDVFQQAHLEAWSPQGRAAESLGALRGDPHLYHPSPVASPLPSSAAPSQRISTAPSSKPSSNNSGRGIRRRLSDR